MTDQEKTLSELIEENAKLRSDIDAIVRENRRLGLAYESLKIAFKTLCFDQKFDSDEVHEILYSIKKLAHESYLTEEEIQ